MNIVPAIPAPDFDLEYNNNKIKLSDLKGKVVLLDCWTYTCIFCLRTIPTINKLKEKYYKYGFEVISAHSFEYEFAQEIKNVEKALDYYKVHDHVFVQDKGNKIWKDYGNMYWPKYILIDHNGFVRYEHPGYGEISEFESPIRELLEEKGEKIIEDEENANVDNFIAKIYGMQFNGIAPEICVGYSRLRSFGNHHKINPNQTNNCIDTGKHEENVVYLTGNWIWEKEGIKVSKLTENQTVKIKYKYAKYVNAIIGTTDNKPGAVEIKLNGIYVPESLQGVHLIIQENKSFVDIIWPRIYNLIKSEKPESHEIEIIPKTENIIFYTFVFG